MKEGIFTCNLMTLGLTSMNDDLSFILETNKNVMLENPKKILALVCTENTKYLQYLHGLLLSKGKFDNEKICLELVSGRKKLLNISAETDGATIKGIVTELPFNEEEIKMHHNAVEELYHF